MEPHRLPSHISKTVPPTIDVGPRQAHGRPIVRSPLGGGVFRLRYVPVPQTKDVIARNLYVQVYLKPYGKPARERLQALVAEAKAGNPFAPVTVVPPNTYSGIGLRRVLAGSWPVTADSST